MARKSKEKKKIEVLWDSGVERGGVQTGGWIARLPEGKGFISEVGSSEEVALNKLFESLPGWGYSGKREDYEIHIQKKK